MEIEKPVHLTDFDFLTVNVIKITKQRCGKKGIVNELPSIFDFACGKVEAVYVSINSRFVFPETLILEMNYPEMHKGNCERIKIYVKECNEPS